MIGIATNSIRNNFDILLDIQEYVDCFECSKYFYTEHFKELDKINLPCSCFASLVIGNYDLTYSDDRKRFITEFIDTCKMSNDLNCHKMMFGLLRFRLNVNEDILKLFEELVYIARDNKQTLLYEALSKRIGSKFLTNHSELIDFSRKHGIESIHVDYKTLTFENEKLGEIPYPISNIHYPIGIPVIIDNDVTLENYEGYTNYEIKKWIKWGKLQ